MTAGRSVIDVTSMYGSGGGLGRACPAKPRPATHPATTKASANSAILFSKDLTSKPDVSPDDCDYSSAPKRSHPSLPSPRPTRFRREL